MWEVCNKLHAAVCVQQGWACCSWHAGRVAAQSVHNRLTATLPHMCMLQASGCSPAQAEVMIKRLADSGRYLKDVW